MVYIHGWIIDRGYRTVAATDPDRMIDIPVINIYGFKSSFSISLKKLEKGYLFEHRPLDPKKPIKPTKTFHKSFHEAVRKFKIMIRRKDPYLYDEHIRAMVDEIYNIAKFSEFYIV